MALSSEQKSKINDYLTEKIREKLVNYNPETNSMPFHYRLLGKNRMALFSFIHSINTTLGTSIFEKVGQLIAGPKSKKSKDRYDLTGYISEQAVLKIDSIMRSLRSATRKPDKVTEIEEIRKVASSGNLGTLITKRADLYIETNDGTEHYFEIKSAKPNINEFTGIKKLLLDWIAMRSSVGFQGKIRTYVAIPYNPYEPQPYDRWTLQGLFDLKEEVVVGKEFWDLLGGNNTYDDILEVFEKVGLSLYEEIDIKMNSFSN